MALSKKLAAEVFITDEDDEQDRLEKKKAQDEAASYESKYQDYCANIGIENSCHIPRTLGEEMSLLTEIVFRPQVKTLFPETKDLAAMEEPLMLHMVHSKTSFSSSDSALLPLRMRSLGGDSSPITLGGTGTSFLQHSVSVESNNMVL